MATVKTAISLDAELFAEAQRTARRLGVPRSRLFTFALREFLAQQENQQLQERLNAVYAAAPAKARTVPAGIKRKHRALVEGTW
jgi:metal-responsive CopG/Arc/MetJ family transcriptional regulator